MHANIGGRVAIGGAVLAGLYVCGWSKRGPSGTIGTNRGCGMATAEAVLADLAAPLAVRVRAILMRCWRGCGRVSGASSATAIGPPSMRPRNARGALLGKPREKFVSVPDMLAAMDA